MIQHSAPHQRALGALGSLGRDVARDFLWNDLKEGAWEWRTLPASIRPVVGLVGLLLCGVLGGLLLEPQLRQAFDLTALPLTVEAAAHRGASVPGPLVPATVLLLSVAFALGLAGTLRAHPAARWALMGFWSVYALTPAWPLALQAWVGDARARLSLLGVVLSLLALPPAQAWLRRRPPRWTLETGVLWILVALPMGATWVWGARDLAASGVPLWLQSLQNVVFSLQCWAIPLFLFLGVDMADFTRMAAGWTVDRVAGSRPWITWAVLAAVAAWRVEAVLLAQADRLAVASWTREAWAHVGALGEVAAVLVTTALVLGLARRGPEPDLEEAATELRDLAFPLAFLFCAPAMGAWLLQDLAGVLVLVPAAARVALALATGITGWTGAWQALLFAGALALGLARARSGQRVSALYLALFGVHGLWITVTRPGAPLEALTWTSQQPTDTLWTLGVLALGTAWALGGRLSPPRGRALLTVLLASALLLQLDLIGFPLTPVLGFLGVGLTVLAFAWDAVSYGRWARQSTPALPSASRVLLYLGYVLAVATLTLWSSVAHERGRLDLFTNTPFLQGLALLGRPLVMAWVALAVRAHLSTDPPGTDP